MGLLYSDNSVRNNVTHHSHNTLKINACSGGIYKTYKESWFTRFNLKDNVAETLFKPYQNELVTNSEKLKKDYPNYYGNYDYYDKETKEKVIILQMVICGDMEVIAELIREQDFNNYFTSKENNLDEKKVEDNNDVQSKDMECLSN